MWETIDIKDVKSFRKDPDSNLMHDYVSISLEMPRESWVKLQKMIEAPHLRNRRKHDNMNGSVSQNQVVEKIQDVSKYCEYWRTEYWIEEKRFSISMKLEDGSRIERRGTSEEMLKFLEELEEDLCPKDQKSQ